LQADYENKADSKLKIVGWQRFIILGSQ